MTATDGNPLTGDPDSDAVRHLLALIVPADRAAQYERIDELIVTLGRRDGLSAAEARARSVGPRDVLGAPGAGSGDVGRRYEAAMDAGDRADIIAKGRALLRATEESA